MLYRFEGFVLDDEIFALRRDGVDVPLRPQALELLLYLTRHRDRAVAKSELLEVMWKGAAVSESALPQAIVAIRRALGDDGGDGRIIRTVRGRGYRLAVDVEVSSDADAASARLEAGEIVGRDGAIRRLDALVRGAITGHGDIALVAGAAGMGKTRLLTELARRARSLGARVLEARCHEGQGAPELWVWVEILRAYGGGPASALARDATSLAVEIAGERASPDASTAGAGARERFVLFDRCVQLLRRAAQHQPIAIFIDDVHHADTASLLLLKLVASSVAGAKLAILVAYRDGAVASRHELARALGALTREDPSRRIALETLGRGDVARLAASFLGEPADEALVTRLLEKTDGNPLLLGCLLEQLRRDRSPARTTTSALLEVFELREAIALHLDGLSEDALEMLRGASVLGAELSPALLAPTLGRASVGLLELLDEALRARILVRTPPGAYRFAHVLVRDVLYRQLTLADRARLHEAAGAAALEQSADEAAVCHLERALRGHGRLVEASSLAPVGDDRARAEALLRALRSRAA